MSATTFGVFKSTNDDGDGVSPSVSVLAKYKSAGTSAAKRSGQKPPVLKTEKSCPLTSTERKQKKSKKRTGDALVAQNLESKFNNVEMPAIT